ncbi:MAG: hypothetical protein EPN82_09675 [Bacteroidetes bacterium]|nr:MAG: hypothetical protein EPN82_09675 [Bacteroidota bacterium]
MKKAIILLIIYIISLPVLADDTKKGMGQDNSQKEEVVKYKPKVIYHSNAYRLYKFTETTNVKRIYSDSSTKEFKREVTYFFTLTIFEKPENGFETVKVVIDSMLYKLTDGDKVVEFNSQAEKIKPIRLKDLEVMSVPLSRQFDMTYSPYGEVAKIESPDIQDEIDFIKEGDAKYGKDKDELKDLIWFDGLSDNRMKHIADLQKIIFSQESMAKDSIWHSPFTIQIDGKDFIDTVSSRIAEYNNGSYTIESKTNNLKPITKAYYFYGVVKPARIESAKGDGYYIIQINPKGIISKVDAEFIIESDCKVRFEPFKEQVQSKMVWEYLGQFKL